MNSCDVNLSTVSVMFLEQERCERHSIVAVETVQQASRQL